ncbi:MAG: HRDC domain-containing protein, partial [Elusimicrobiota bacterium]
LEVVEGEYPLLRITEAGKALCRDEGEVRLAVPAPSQARGRKKSRKGAGHPGVPAAWPADGELFERLRRLRRQLAEKLGVPPYVVFHDSALAEMAALKPKTLEAFRGVKGVGDRKSARYGAAFLEVIAERPL